MTRLGLALSGGGFRATLYHLGVVRFLRDAEVLPKVTHITAVSGGSILGAHLVQHWDKYCGSDDEFQRAAEEIVRFVQLDVRNRIVRRFPLAGGANSLLRLARVGARRRLSRAGLLEQHYERFLYGDVTLDELPDRPQLHIMATNLSEGCLCSFNRNGLLLQRRVLGRRDHFEHVNIGLATVPMAVAASSAFPGFFPPLELNAWDVGADEGEFKTQAFTDGGVYDNLGLRMFRYIEQLSFHDSASLGRADFLEFDDTMTVLMSAESLPEQTPLRRIRELASAYLPQDRRSDEAKTAIIRGLDEIIRTKDLYLEPSLHNVELSDPAAQSLRNFAVHSKRRPDLSDRIWLNRNILEAALRQSLGKPSLRINRSEFDAILVSDSGGKFKRTTDGRAGGLIRTGLRASDILMDRVWQMELEANENTQGLIHIPITDVVERAQDAHAPHPEVQRQAARIRTDLDRFSDLEIAALVQHGYCLARNACRTKLEILDRLPEGEPWEPMARANRVQSGQQEDRQQAIDRARRLRSSSNRRIGTTLFSARDWITYLWIPLIALVVFSLPYALYHANRRAQLHRTVLAAIAETNPVYGQILELMESEPKSGPPSMQFEEVSSLEPADHSGFQFDSAARIFDLRQWFDATKGEDPLGVGYTRLRVRRNTNGNDNAHLKLQFKGTADDSGLSCQTQSLRPTLKRQALGDGQFLWELDLDFSRIPVETDTEVVVRHDFLTDVATVTENGGRLDFSVRAPISIVQVWVLMPKGRAYDSIQVVSHPIDEPQQAKVVVPDSTVELPYGSIAMFRLIDPDTNHSYHCSWNWLD